MSIFQLPLPPLPPIRAPSIRPESLTTTFLSSNFDSLTTKLSTLSLHPQPRKTLTIRMGGGPRTYPGGVSKWQWKRMQAKKAKQLMKARLCRERQIYEMRKRAELKAAVSELERPWEVVERAPTLFSVKADEQLKVLADRFQRPGGFDMWSEKDGPQLFEPVDGLPSARFFPKGVVHSVKPYAKVTDEDLFGGVGGEVSEFGGGQRRRRRRELKGGLSGGDFVESEQEDNVGSDSTLNLVVKNLEGKSGGTSRPNAKRKPNRRNDRCFSQNGAMSEHIGSQGRLRGIDSGSGEKGVGSESRQRGNGYGSGERGPGSESRQRGNYSGSGQRGNGYGSRQRGIGSGSRERHFDSGVGRRGGVEERSGPGREHKEGRRVVNSGQNEFQRSNGSGKSMRSESDVYDMRLQHDGS
uniref:DEAD-box ATP-dependent RNA helicase 33 n=1 Tax=Kalanchoe fedtschenkoi TaxID=63787 RepID=A0A7N0UZ36_KALFE